MSDVPFVTIHHAELDCSASVPVTAVPAFVDRGWMTDAEDADAEPHDEFVDTTNDATPQGSHDTRES